MTKALLTAQIVAAHGRHYLANAGDKMLHCFTRGKKSDVAVGETRERFRQMLRSGVFDEKEVEMPVDVKAHVGFELMGSSGNMEDLQNALSSLGNMFSTPGKKTSYKGL